METTTTTGTALQGTDASDTLQGGVGADTIHGGAGSDQLHGNDGNDIIHGGDEDNAASRGGDVIVGGGGDDSLYGGSGQDTLYGGEGNNLLEGEGGDDTLSGGSDGSDTLRGGAGDDTLSSWSGSAGSALLEGGDGNDRFEGDLDDTFLGGAGNDTFEISSNVHKTSGGTADGGDGDDTFRINGSANPATITLTGGTGSDLYIPSTVGEFRTVITFTDFATGPGGDRIDLFKLISNIPGGNPFGGTRPELRLVQSGADVLLERLPPGADSYILIARFSNSSAAAFTADNFVGHVDPNGSPDGMTITGTGANEQIDGNRLNDTLDGGAGADTIYGADGNDLISGGDDSGPGADDRLYGEGGNDTLSGGAGNDVVSSGFGDDLLYGGDGDDYMLGQFGSDTIYGGAGDDRITAGYSGMVDGGAGNDEIRTVSGPASHGSLAIDGGDGNDKIFLRVSTWGTIVIDAHGGAGADQFVLESMPFGEKYVISDFSSAQGDSIDVRPLLPYSMTGNPFGAQGYLRLEQRGADTVISIDNDGAAGSAVAWRDLITLRGVSATTLDGTAFAGSFDPSGSLVGVTRTGTDGADTLTGTTLDDTLTGLGGSDSLGGDAGNDHLSGGDETIAGQGDHLYGGSGNDTLDAGAGADYLQGDDGDDTLEGGDGNDQLWGGSGNDSLNGGEGNDRLSDDAGNDVMFGMDGDDTLSTHSPGRSLLSGGAGNDTMEASGGDHILNGGDGNDTITVNGSYASYWRDTPPLLAVEGGHGDDTIVIGSGSPGSSIAAEGGWGKDTYRFAASPSGMLAVTDFIPGPGGDVLDLLAIFAASAPLTGNPFASVHVRLLQDGADTLVQVDEDGAAGSAHALRTIAILRGVTATALTADNFIGGMRPDGTSTGSTIVGGAGNDKLDGSLLDDVLDGVEGNDTISAGAGNDTALGGTGNDQLSGGHGNDHLLGGDGDDDGYGGEGDDTIDGGDGHDWLYGSAGDDSLLGSGGNDRLNGGDGHNTILGGSGNDTIEGADEGVDSADGGAGDDNLSGSANDTLAGGAGNDWLSITIRSGGVTSAFAEGGDGDDSFGVGLYDALAAATVTGGAGADTFRLRPVDSWNPAIPFAYTVSDFQPGVDRIDLSGMEPWGTPGNPFGSAGLFRFVQRGADAVLQFDGDGASGPKAFQDVMVLSNVNASVLTARDIAGGLSPDGSNRGYDATGTDASDVINGGRLDDTLAGGLGNDTITGGDGNDIIDGQAGKDNITGGAGNDTLRGGDADDVLSDDAGENSMSGGDGDDVVSSTSRAASRLEGGAGNDLLRGGVASDTLAGGAGDDTVVVYAPAAGTTPRVVVEGGDGADRLELAYSATGMHVTATGGAGMDSYRFDMAGFEGELRITDFAAGAGGDQIDISRLGSYWTLGDQSPFGAPGYLRVVQQGADTWLQYDEDGAAGTAKDFRTIAVLAGVQASSLTGHNFSGGYSPDGALAGLRLDGTADNDVLTGGNSDDTATGGAGADTINGGAGNDHLDGGDGNDVLYGGADADTALGGLGEDTLVGGSGDDLLSGGDGNDTLEDAGGRNALNGGDGHDTLVSSGGNSLLDGGAGNDTITGSRNDTLSGGSGNDKFSIRSYTTHVGATSLLADGGDGDDWFSVWLTLKNEAVRVSGGAGRDTYEMLVMYDVISYSITDFQAGDGGDKIDVSYLMKWHQLATNPFGAPAVLRLVQRGADTVLQFDTDGQDEPAPFEDLVVLEGVTASSLTADNFGGHAPFDIPAGPADYTGTPGADAFEGGALNDSIAGGAGDDTLNGGAGNDLLEGGDGIDSIDGGNGNDSVNGDAGDDIILDTDGDDTLHGGAGNDSIEAGSGNDVISGGTGNDVIDGGSGDDMITADSGDDTVDGGIGNDIVRARFESGAASAVRATGGSGRDTFMVEGVAESVNLSIVDFSVADGDVIDLLQLLAPEDRTQEGVYSHLRTEQVGSDTVIWFDRDGSGSGSYGWHQLLTLAGVDRASLGTVNFAAGLAPHLQDVPEHFVGSAGADSITGGRFDDILDGNLGDDSLAGGAGNDQLRGGDGMDSLDGGIGNDVLSGGAGNDWLSDADGNNQLYGEAGADYLQTTSTGATLLDGGDGDDTLSGGAGDATLRGGIGDDVLRITGQAGATAPAIVLEGGAGTDTYHFSGPPMGVRITDFNAGVGGDRLDVLSLFADGTLSGDPFSAGMLRVVQNGADTELQLDPDGVDGALHGWSTIAVLAGVDANTLSADNFKHGMVPNRLPILGTQGDDVILGGTADDTISGLDGNDNVSGSDGNDILDGGAGNDTLVGGEGIGNDLLEGGAGDDYLHGSGGRDTLHGGAGNDQLDAYETAGHLNGGDGDDWITVGAVSTPGLAVTIDGGAGQDHLNVSISHAASAAVLAIGGQGRDTFAASIAAAGSSVTIGDFSVSDGDILSFVGVLPPEIGNPFGAQGHLRAEQTGDDTVIWFDRDGAAGSEFTWQTLLTLTGVDRSKLSSANFHGGLDIDGLPGPVQVAGDSGANRMNGSMFADTLSGGLGNDTVGGGAGDDNLAGSEGNDRLDGHTGNDTIDGGTGIDTVHFGGDVSNYTWTWDNGVLIVECKDGLDGIDRLTNVERISFAETTIAFDVGADGTAGQVYRLYQAAFGRTPDIAGLEWWIKAADAGMPLADISAHFMQSSEFADLYGASPNTAELVRALYVNALHREPDDAGVEYWTQVLDKGLALPAVVLTGFSESTENQESVAKVIGGGITLGPWV